MVYSQRIDLLLIGCFYTTAGITGPPASSGLTKVVSQGVLRPIEALEK